MNSTRDVKRAAASAPAAEKAWSCERGEAVSIHSLIDGDTSSKYERTRGRNAVPPFPSIGTDKFLVVLC